MVEEYDEHWTMSKKKLIKDAFELFDKDKKGTVPQDEVRTILQYLNLFPKETALAKEILPDMHEDEPTTHVAYDKFEDKVLELMKDKSCEPSGEERLLQCFRKLDDYENTGTCKGYIEAGKMRDMLAQKGKAPFREKEIDGT